MIVPNTTPIEIPDSDDLNDLRTYTYNGQQYSATELSPGTYLLANYGPTPTNPAGVYFVNGDMSLLGSNTINGTLLVRGGSLTVSTLYNKITAQPGFPALVVDQDIVVSGLAAGLEVNGLTWVGRNITSVLINTGSVVNINGALVMGGNGNFSSSYTTGALNITYDSTKAYAPTLSSTVSQVPVSVEVVEWNP